MKPINTKNLLPNRVRKRFIEYLRCNKESNGQMNDNGNTIKNNSKLSPSQEVFSSYFVGMMISKDVFNNIFLVFRLVYI